MLSVFSDCALSVHSQCVQIVCALSENVKKWTPDLLSSLEHLAELIMKDFGCSCPGCLYDIVYTIFGIFLICLIYLIHLVE